MKVLRPDSKGRITLGALARGVSGYRVTQGGGCKIVLEPLVEVPVREAWLHENKAALVSVERGLEQASKGDVHDLGSFQSLLDDDE